jgi:hypothetical protein
MGAMATISPSINLHPVILAENPGLGHFVVLGHGEQASAQRPSILALLSSACAQPNTWRPARQDVGGLAAGRPPASALGRA